MSFEENWLGDISYHKSFPLEACMLSQVNSGKVQESFGIYFTREPLCGTKQNFHKRAFHKLSRELFAREP